MTVQHQKPSQNTSNILIDVLALCTFSFLALYPWIGFPWKVPIVAVLILAFTYYRERTVWSLGLKSPSIYETFKWGVITALIIVVGISNLLNPFVQWVLNEPIDYSAYGALKGNTSFVINYWWKAMLSAAIAEEIFYRGFLFALLEKYLASFKYKEVIIVVSTAIFFAAAHNFQGISGMFGILAAALVFGGMYYKSGKNLYAMILAHALVDTWGLFSLYHGGIKLFF